MNEKPETRGLGTAAVLRKSLKRLVWATVLLYVVLFAIGLKVYLDGRNTTKALCTLRTDLQVRVNSSIDFLSEHPEGIPGISPKMIRDGIENQQRTISALQGLDCPPKP